MLPALDRMPEIRRLVGQKAYFVIHAPRQTGKTTAVQALVDEINAKGEKVALYCTLETLQNATDVDWAMKQIRGLLLRCATAVPEPPEKPDARGAWCVREDPPDLYTVAMVSDTLTQLCRRFGKPLVVRIIAMRNYADHSLVSPLLQETEELIKIFYASVTTARRNLNEQNGR